MDSWEEEVRWFILEEEEEDDELFLVLVSALQLCIYDEKEPEPEHFNSDRSKICQGSLRRS
jgi:hypothetical protein